MSLGTEQVIIGKQTWSGRNFDSVRFQNGDLIPQVLTSEEWEAAGIEGKPAWCFYNNDPENGQRHGVLYNSFAVNDPRGLAPKGWRLPSPDDWDELIAFLGGNKSAGKKMKATESWMVKENEQSGNGTNESGFEAYPSGQRDFLGKFHRLNLSCSWWSVSKLHDGATWFYYLDHDSDRMERGIYDPEDGLSIRLIKETTHL